MNDELLIEVVQSHPGLYDLFQPKFMDTGINQTILYYLRENDNLWLQTVYGGAMDVRE